MRTKEKKVCEGYERKETAVQGSEPPQQKESSPEDHSGGGWKTSATKKSRYRSPDRGERRLVP